MECLRSVAESAQSLKLRGSDLVGVKTRSGEKNILLSVRRKYFTVLNVGENSLRKVPDTFRVICRHRQTF